MLLKTLIIALSRLIFFSFSPMGYGCLVVVSLDTELHLALAFRHFNA